MAQHENTDALDESALLARLAELPLPALDHAAGERIRRRARAVFVRESERRSHAWLSLVTRFYHRVEPVMTATVAASYLVWAFQSVIALHQ